MMLIYTAKFIAQAWVNDYAIPVDPEGPDTWDCSAYMQALPDDAAREAAMEPDTYESDAVRESEDAPGWVREWGGPFYIIIESLEASDHE